MQVHGEQRGAWAGGFSSPGTYTYPPGGKPMTPTTVESHLLATPIDEDLFSGNNRLGYATTIPAQP